MVSNTWRPFKFGCRHSALFRMQIMYKRIKQHNQHPFLNGLSATRNPHEHAQPERHPGLCRIAPTVRQSPYEQCSCANDSLWPHLHLDMSVHLWGIRLSLWKVGGEACNTAPLRLCPSLADGKCSHRFRGAFALPGAELESHLPTSWVSGCWQRYRAAQPVTFLDNETISTHQFLTWYHFLEQDHHTVWS